MTEGGSQSTGMTVGIGPTLEIPAASFLGRIEAVEATSVQCRDGLALETEIRRALSFLREPQHLLRVD